MYIALSFFSKFSSSRSRRVAYVRAPWHVLRCGDVTSVVSRGARILTSVLMTKHQKTRYCSFQEGFGITVGLESKKKALKTLSISEITLETSRDHTILDND